MKWKVGSGKWKVESVKWKVARGGEGEEERGREELKVRNVRKDENRE